MNGRRKGSVLRRTVAACVMGALAVLAAPAVLSQPAAGPGVGVVGGRLLRDGRPWTPHGVVQIAFVAPPAAQKGVFAEAFDVGRVLRST